MRKITSDAIEAFDTDKNFRRNNTKVIARLDVTELYLYNNLIAYKQVESGNIYISSQGYQTRTTSDRLNGLVEYYEYGNVYIHQFTMYYKDSNKITSVLDNNFFTQLR